MLDALRTYFLVAIGGALGSVARYWISGLITARAAQAFPWGTLVVNVTGSFVIGLLAVLAGESGRLQPNARAFAVQFLMVGVCGGYTTFSAFSLATLKLLQMGQWFAALANVLLSVVLCVIGVWLGWIAGQWLNR